MATKAHCAFCFETLAANFERRKPLSLSQVEQLWAEYHTNEEDSTEDGLDNLEDDEDSQMTDVEAEDGDVAKPAAISRLLNRVGASSSDSSRSSTSSTRSTSSSQSGNNTGSGSATPASSKSSTSSQSTTGVSSKTKRHNSGEFPLFVTWNTLSHDGDKHLRGCIGTFEAQELEYGLRSYAFTSASEDTRFQPIPSSLLPSLSNHVTLLTNFSTPTRDPMAWTLGKHGLRISFTIHGRRYGSTYLPDVAKEQGWTKEETLVSLMRKAGWNGSSSSWEKTWRDARAELITYEGKQVGLNYDDWYEWREWVDRQSLKGVNSIK